MNYACSQGCSLTYCIFILHREETANVQGIKKNENEVSPVPPHLFSFLSLADQVKSFWKVCGAYLFPKYHLFSYFKVWSEWFMSKTWERTIIHPHFSFDIFILRLVWQKQNKLSKFEQNDALMVRPTHMHPYLHISSFHSPFYTSIWMKSRMVFSQSTTCPLCEALWHHCLRVMRLFP